VFVGGPIHNKPRNQLKTKFYKHLEIEHFETKWTLKKIKIKIGIGT